MSNSQKLSAIIDKELDRSMELMRFIRYLLLGFLFFYAQVLLAPKLGVWEIFPSFMLGFIVFAAINLELIESAAISFVLGIALDLLNPHLLGSHSILFLMLTFIVFHLQDKLNKDKPVPVLISILLLNFLYLLPLLMIKLVIFGFEGIRLPLAFPQLLYNTLVTVIVLIILTVTQKMTIVLADQ